MNDSLGTPGDSVGLGSDPRNSICDSVGLLSDSLGASIDVTQYYD